MEKLNLSESTRLALEAMQGQGISKGHASCIVSTKEELCFDGSDTNQLRTTTSHSLNLRAIRDSRKATLALGTLEREALKEAAAEIRGLCDAAEADPLHDIAPKQPRGTIARGPTQADLPAMRERMREFLAHVKEKHPKIVLREGHVDFTRAEGMFATTTGTEIEGSQGAYSFIALFTAKDSGRTSSLNYTSGSFPALDRPFHELFGLEELLTQSAQQLDARQVPEKFTGEVLLTPACLRDLLGSYLAYLGDAPMIAGTSVFRGKLGEKIASPLLNVRSHPRHPEAAWHELFDGDGFASEPMEILEKGVLKSYLLSLYGAKKTGLPRALNSGGHVEVAAGDKPRDEMVRGMKRGLLFCRFSGGYPSADGDFSGIAKNSFYVENGKVQHAVAETMVSGNLLRLFESVRALSKERLRFGSGAFPWLLSDGVTISGK